MYVIKNKEDNVFETLDNSFDSFLSTETIITESQNNKNFNNKQKHVARKLLQVTKNRASKKNYYWYIYTRCQNRETHFQGEYEKL